MTDFSNLVDWASRVYPIENYDTYEEWESDVIEDLEDSGHLPSKTDNLFNQLEQYWKGHSKKKTKEPKQQEPTEDEEPTSRTGTKSELPPREEEPELPKSEPVEEIERQPVRRKPIHRKEPEERTQPVKKKSFGERVKGFFGRFRRKK